MAHRAAAGAAAPGPPGSRHQAAPSRVHCAVSFSHQALVSSLLLARGPSASAAEQGQGPFEVEAGKGPSLPLLCHLPRPSLLPVFWVPLCAWGYLSNGQKPFLGLGAQASSWGVTPKEISDCQAQVPPGLPPSTSMSLAGVVRSICSVQAALSWSRVSWVAPGSGFPLSVSTSTSVALRLFPRRAGTPPPSWLPFCLSVSGCLI